MATRKRMGPRRGANPGMGIGGVLGILAGWSIGGTIGGPVGSTSGYIGALLGALVGISAGLFLGYWIGAGIGRVTRRSRPRQRHQASQATLVMTKSGDTLVPERKTLLGQGCAVAGILCGLLMLFSIVVLPAMVVGIVGLALALVPASDAPWPGRVVGLVVGGLCIFYLWIVIRSTVRALHPKRSAGKEPVLLEAHTSHGPGTLTVTPSYVSIVRAPLPGYPAPELVLVPREEIVKVTRHAPWSAAVAISSFFGVLTSLTIHTRDGRVYGVDGVPVWEARRLVRLLSTSSS